MMIEVRLFGQLRHCAGDGRAPSGTAVHLESQGGETVADVLSCLGIEPSEVGNLFLNGRLLPRSLYPITLGYPLAATEPLSEEAWLKMPVGAGDRLGVFPCNMAVVVV